MNIVWTDFAKENIRSIFTYYKINADEEVALKIIGNILESKTVLKNFPEAGKELAIKTSFEYGY